MRSSWFAPLPAGICEGIGWTYERSGVAVEACHHAFLWVIPHRHESGLAILLLSYVSFMASSDSSCCLSSTPLAVVNLMERSSSSSESELSSSRSRRGMQASRVHDEAAPSTTAAEGYHSETSDIRPMRFLKAPSGLKLDETSTSPWHRRPRGTRPSLSHVLGVVEDIKVRVQVAVGEIE
ncbi:hypothetical protein Nepgr_012764 [Nepenthes gracilis]|uniref:Uncharacterized protein n=1 Tax=Nepenthes gracilis TaxID=150966 RepID=A0AAD3SGQ2_NEPGR|nr:hypothetical protein Nepgr_012764 [Nepenthes gracilis]